MSTTNRKHPDYLRGAEPYKYDEKYVTEVVRLASMGKSMVEIGAAFGLGNKTLYGWSRIYPTFKKAYDQARLKFNAWLIDSMKKGLSDRNYNANTAALLLRYVVGVDNTGSLEGGVDDVKQSLNTILKTHCYTADQKCKLVQAIETSVRALESSDAIGRIDALEEHVKMHDKTRVGKN